MAEGPPVNVNEAYVAPAQQGAGPSVRLSDIRQQMQNGQQPTVRVQPVEIIQEAGQLTPEEIAKQKQLEEAAKFQEAQFAQRQAAGARVDAAKQQGQTDRVWVDTRKNPPEVVKDIDAALKAEKLEMVIVVPNGNPGEWDVTKQGGKNMQGAAMFVEEGKFKVGDTVRAKDNHPFFKRQDVVKPGAVIQQEAAAQPVRRVTMAEARAQMDAEAARAAPVAAQTAPEQPAPVARDGVAVVNNLGDLNKFARDARDMLPTLKSNPPSPEMAKLVDDMVAKHPNISPEVRREMAEVLKGAPNNPRASLDISGVHARVMGAITGKPVGESLTQRTNVTPQVPGFVPEPTGKMPSAAEIAATTAAPSADRAALPKGIAETRGGNMDLPPVAAPSPAERAKRYAELDTTPAEARRMVEPNSEPNRNGANASVAARLPQTAGMAADGNSDKFYNSFGLRPALNPDGSVVTIRMADPDTKKFPNGQGYILFEQKDGPGADAVLLTPAQAMEAISHGLEQHPEAGALAEAFQGYVAKAAGDIAKGTVSFDNIRASQGLSPAAQAGVARLSGDENKAELIEAAPEQFQRAKPGAGVPQI